MKKLLLISFGVALFFSTMFVHSIPVHAQAAFQCTPSTFCDNGYSTQLTASCTTIPTACPNGCDSNTGQCNSASQQPTQPSSPAKAGPLEYAPLEPLPFITYTKDQNKNWVYSGNSADLINGYFKILLSIGSVLAVVMIVWYGISYMTSDIGGKKAQAKARMQSALLGLFLLLGAWIILNTINPKLLNVSLVLPHLTSQNQGNNSNNPTPSNSGTTCGNSICAYGNNNLINIAIIANKFASWCYQSLGNPLCNGEPLAAWTADKVAGSEFGANENECRNDFNGGTVLQLNDINGSCDSIKGKGSIIAGNQTITFNGCLDIPNVDAGWTNPTLPWDPTKDSYPLVCVYNQ